MRKRLSLHLATLVLLAALATATQGGAQAATAQADDSDRAVLVALYTATDGPRWANSDNWLSDAPIGDWFGVTTDDSGRVTALRLAGNDLHGQIPMALSSLSVLEELDLAGNWLTGEIPSALGDMANLEFLDLSYNWLSGGIPSALGALANLRELYLSDNRLSGEIPSTLGDLATLEVLVLSNNHLNGAIPPALGNLTNLSILRKV